MASKKNKQQQQHQFNPWQEDRAIQAFNEDETNQIELRGLLDMATWNLSAAQNTLCHTLADCIYAQFPEGAKTIGDTDADKKEALGEQLAGSRFKCNKEDTWAVFQMLRRHMQQPGENNDKAANKQVATALRKVQKRLNTSKTKRNDWTHCYSADGRVNPLAKPFLSHFGPPKTPRSAVKELATGVSTAHTFANRLLGGATKGSPEPAFRCATVRELKALADLKRVKGTHADEFKAATRYLRFADLLLTRTYWPTTKSVSLSTGSTKLVFEPNRHFCLDPPHELAAFTSIAPMNGHDKKRFKVLQDEFDFLTETGRAVQEELIKSAGTPNFAQWVDDLVNLTDEDTLRDHDQHADWIVDMQVRSMVRLRNRYAIGRRTCRPEAPVRRGLTCILYCGIYNSPFAGTDNDSVTRRKKYAKRHAELAKKLRDIDTQEQAALAKKLETKEQANAHEQ